MSWINKKPSVVAALAAALAIPSTLAVTEDFINARWTLANITSGDDSSSDDSSEESPFKGWISGHVMYDDRPLCDDNFNDHAATVLCKHFQLGNFGKWEGVDVGTDDFGADELTCPSYAQNVDDCTYDTHFEDCTAFEGVKLYCSIITLSRTMSEIFFEMSGDAEYPERPKNVGIVHFNFKPVCDDHINEFSANALCRTMGLGWYGEFQHGIDVGTDDFSIDDLMCPAGAESLHECTVSEFEEDCDSHEGVYLKCNDGWSLITPDDVNAFHNEGFVTYRGKPLCENDAITDHTADLICQSIGMGFGKQGKWSVRTVPADAGDFSPVSPVCEWEWLHIDDCDLVDAVCTDDSAMYLTCGYHGWNLRQADKGELAAGEDRYHSGYVFKEGKPLCFDEGLSHVPWEADRLCQTMERGYAGRWVRHVGHALDSSDVEFVANLSCEDENENEIIWLEHCRSEIAQGCQSSEVAFLQCHSGWTLGKSRWGGDSWDGGFLLHDGESICTEGFSDKAATLFCRHWWGIGWIGDWEQKFRNTNWFLSGVPTKTFSCPPGFEGLDECVLADVTENENENCSQENVVYLTCRPSFTLERGNDDRDGFIYYDDKPLCAQDLGSYAAGSVLCRQLNLGIVGSIVFRPVGTDDFSESKLSCPDDAKWLDDCEINSGSSCDVDEVAEGLWLECAKGWTLEEGGENEGLVFYNGLPLCDDLKTNDDDDYRKTGEMLCQAMGKGHVVEVRAEQSMNFFEDFGADDLNCTGAETMADCSFLTYEHDCGADEGVYLICSGSDGWSLLSEEHGDNLYEGIVHYNGKPLCDDGLDLNAGNALCNTITGVQGRLASFEIEHDVLTWEFGADELSCPEGASSVWDCTFDQEHDCGSLEGVYLSCTCEYQVSENTFMPRMSTVAAEDDVHFPCECARICDEDHQVQYYTYEPLSQRCLCQEGRGRVERVEGQFITGDVRARF